MAIWDKMLKIAIIVFLPIFLVIPKNADPATVESQTVGKFQNYTSIQCKVPITKGVAMVK